MFFELSEKNFRNLSLVTFHYVNHHNASANQQDDRAI